MISLASFTSTDSRRAKSKGGTCRVNVRLQCYFSSQIHFFSSVYSVLEIFFRFYSVFVLTKPTFVHFQQQIHVCHSHIILVLVFINQFFLFLVLVLVHDNITVRLPVYSMTV